MGETQDIFWMYEAILAAQRAEQNGEVPIGAVLVKDNNCISQGWNQPILLKDPSAHAEILALRKAGQVLENYRLLETTLYVTLEPCVMCVGAIIQARVKRLVYGACDPKAGAVCSLCQLQALSHNHIVEVTSGVLKEACGTLLTNFFKSKR